jgi:hypothetical protein
MVAWKPHRSAIMEEILRQFCKNMIFGDFSLEFSDSFLEVTTCRVCVF